MFRNRFGDVIQVQPPIQNSAAEIHVFKPKREKRLIEPAQFFPDFTANHEERASRLLHLAT